jgi:hypothetical protein
MRERAQVQAMLQLAALTTPIMFGYRFLIAGERTEHRPVLPESGRLSEGVRLECARHLAGRTRLRVPDQDRGDRGRGE